MNAQRRVLVTGGGTGIGRAIAHAFAAQGDRVTIAGRREGPLQETAEGFDIETAPADVTQESDVAALFAQPFDIVIANAGAGTASKLVDVSLAQWQA